MGIKTVSVFSEDDHLSLHTRHSESAVNLGQAGVAAYLNAENLIQVAKETGCDAIHPGYGFLSESARSFQSCVLKRVYASGIVPQHSVNLVTRLKQEISR